jgi:hypothetical protein
MGTCVRVADSAGRTHHEQIALGRAASSRSNWFSLIDVFDRVLDKGIAITPSQASISVRAKSA